MFQSVQSAFTVEILDYENPEAGQTVEEVNLLLTCLRVADRGHRWEVITPFLHTWDMNKILNWFSDIVADREVPDGLSFAEPFLCLELRSVVPDRGHYCFAISLRDEAAPHREQVCAIPYVLLFDVDRAGICQAIHGLTDQIKQFPVRACCRNA